MNTLRYSPLLLCLCVGQALAGTPLSITHAASAKVHVSISNTAGSVSVTAWDRNEVQVVGELGDGAKPLQISGNDNDLTVKVEPQGGAGWLNWSSDSRMGSTRLELHVPRAASVDVRVVSAPLVIDGLDGGAIEVDSVSGRARINARSPSLSIKTVSGGIELAGHAAQANLQTVSGDILAPTLGDGARLQTISGHIQASGGPWKHLTVSTVSGDVQLGGSLAPDGNIGIDSMSGDVQLQLPGDTTGKLHASSFSGDLRTDFGTPQKPEHGPGSRLDAVLGSANGVINVETFSGDLRIRKKD